MNEGSKTAPTITDEAIDVLSSLLATAPEACNKLMDLRVDVLSTVTDKVFCAKVGEKYKLGILGLINGVLDASDMPRIAAVYDDNDELVRFTTYKPKS